jgi:hypothetical protein
LEVDELPVICGVDITKFEELSELCSLDVRPVILPRFEDNELPVTLGIDSPEAAVLSWMVPVPTLVICPALG